MTPGLYNTKNELLANWNKLVDAGLDITHDYDEYRERTHNRACDVFQFYCEPPEKYKLIIPEGIERIGDYVFFNCTRLLEVNIPDSVKTIGKGAFRSCESINSIEFSDNIKEIKAEIFHNCCSLKNIKLSNSLTKIPDHCFSYCIGLKEIKLPKNIKTIEQYAFSMTDLENIIIPKNVNQINYYAFDYCDKLQKIVLINDVNRDFMYKFRNKIVYADLDVLIENGTSFKEANKILKDNEVNER